MPRMPCPLINRHRALVAMSSGKVLPMNMEISPTNMGIGIEQRSCKVRLGEAAAVGNAGTTEGTLTAGSSGIAGGATTTGRASTKAGGGTAWGGFRTGGSAADSCATATCVGQSSCKVRRW